MDILGSWLDAAKQMAHSAIKDKIEHGSLASGQLLLGMLRDAVTELSEERRQQLLARLDKVLSEYRTQPHFDLERVWKETVEEPVIQELAAQVSKRLVKSFVDRLKQGGSQK